MGVPEEIRKVPRPKNTIVVDYGDRIKSDLRYAVRERRGVRYIPHGNPQPISGRVIGHIIHGEFVPLQPRAKTKARTTPDFLCFGPSAFVHSVGDDIYDDLLSVYEIGEATQIMVMASLKAIDPSVRYARMSTEYEAIWLSIYYPGVPLSEKTISELLLRVGMSSRTREAFFRKFGNEEFLEEISEQSGEQGDARCNYSAIGSDFVNFIAEVLIRRMQDAATEAGLMEDLFLTELLRDLSHTYRLVSSKDEEPVYGDAGWVGCLPESMRELAALKLCRADEKYGFQTFEPGQITDATPRKRGRPRIHPLPDLNQPKRPRGRSRKTPAPASENSK